MFTFAFFAFLLNFSLATAIKAVRFGQIDMALTHGGSHVCYAPEGRVGLDDVGYSRRRYFGSSVVQSTVLIYVPDGTILQ